MATPMRRAGHQILTTGAVTAASGFKVTGVWLFAVAVVRLIPGDE
jgi:hypothetical protein